MADNMQPVFTIDSGATAVNHDTNRPATPIAVAGYNKVYLAVSGTAGTMKLEAQVSMDKTNWLTVGAIQLSDGVNKTAATGIVATGAYEVPVAGFVWFRTFLSAVDGTTLTVKATVFPK